MTIYLKSPTRFFKKLAITAILSLGFLLSVSNLNAANPVSETQVNNQITTLSENFATQAYVNEQIEASMGPTPSGTEYEIGDYAQGGIIFYLDPSKQHGLVCAVEDQTSAAYLITSTILPPVKVGAYASEIYLGRVNTNSYLAFEGVNADGTSAVDQSKSYRGPVGDANYDDWYVPSTTELILMYQNRDMINEKSPLNGGSAFSPLTYWSSTQDSNGLGGMMMNHANALAVSFNNLFTTTGKAVSYPITTDGVNGPATNALRVIRSF